MEQASVVLFWFSLLLLTGATVLYAYQFLLRRPTVAWWARFATGAGFLFLTASIGFASSASDGTSFSGQNQLILGAWALVLLYFVMEHLIKLKVYGTFLVPLAVIMLVLSQFVGPPSAELPPEQAAQVKSWLIAAHVALIVFANAGFAVGAVSSGLYLYQEAQLKRHKTNRLTRRLPSLATLHFIARRAIVFSYPLYSAGLLFGVIRAIQEDVGGWWADPRIIMAGLVWFTFGTYLLLLYRRGVSIKTASWIAILGLVLVVALAVIARTLPVGFHVFGVG